MAKKPRSWPEESLPLAGMVMDNHTHLPVHELQIPKADGIRLSLEDQLARAQDAGISQIVTCACELPDFQPMIDLARAHTHLRVALAIHPNDAALHAGCAQASPDGLQPEVRDYHIPLDEALNEVERAITASEVVAVGETGLDYFRTAEEGREAQKESFIAHLKIAAAAGLPLQIHDRDAHADTLAILKEHATADQVIVFHCYSGDKEMAQILAENGWYASFAGPITYPANTQLREAFLAMPVDLVLVETDAPYLTPVPYRGQPNASYVMTHTVRYMGQLWGNGEEATCERLLTNSQRVYGVW